MDASVAAFLARDAYGALRRRSVPPYVFVHDWSACQSYDSRARAILTDWGRLLGDEMRAVRIYVGPDAPKIVKMGLSVACSALAVLGYDVAPTTDLLRTFRDLGVQSR